MKNIELRIINTTWYAAIENIQPISLIKIVVWQQNKCERLQYFTNLKGAFKTIKGLVYVEIMNIGLYSDEERLEEFYDKEY
jgi:hypothetical protein